MNFILKELPETISEQELIDEVGKLNRDPAVHGLIVQLPLPSHIKESKIVESVDPKKDVDGLHPLNSGFLSSFYIPYSRTLMSKRQRTLLYPLHSKRLH